MNWKNVDPSSDGAIGLALLLRARFDGKKLARLWTEHGRPSDLAFDFIEGKGGRRIDLSSSETVLLCVAIDLFNGHGKTSVSNVLRYLDGAQLAAVAEALAAVADGFRARAVFVRGVLDKAA